MRQRLQLIAARALSAGALAVAACTPTDFVFVGGSGGAGAGGGAGGSAPEPCVPPATRPCYDGPEATRAVGACKEGVSTCSPEAVWGPCEGQTLPAIEDCTTGAVDENCDEHPGCDGTLAWMRGFGAADGDVARGVATYQGAVVVAGSSIGAVDFGAGVVDGGGATDAFVAVLDAQTGATAVARVGGDAGAQLALTTATGPTGDIVVAGAFEGTIDWGGGAMTSAGASDGFVAIFDRDLAHRFSARFGDAEPQAITAVAIDPEGNIYLAGDLVGVADLGGGPLQSAGATDVFVARLDADGHHVWSRAYGGAGGQRPVGIAVRDGSVAVAGSYDADFSMGGDVLVAGPPNDAIFVARLTAASGAHVWSRGFGTTTDQDVFGVALDASGNVVTTGSFEEAIDFGGGGALTGSGPNKDAFLVSLAAADGHHLWSHGWGGAGEQLGRAVAVDGLGQLLIAGELSGTVDFGVGPLVSAGGSDPFVVKLDPGGTTLWSRRFGGAADGQRAHAVALGADGSVYMAGEFAVAFEPDGPVSQGAGDAFVVKVRP